MAAQEPTMEEKGKKSVSFREKSRIFFPNYDFRSLTIFAILMLIFSFFMFIPIMTVSIAAFNFSDPSNLFEHFLYCFDNFSFRQSIMNTLFVGLTTTLICSIIGLTVTIIFSRYQFTGKKFFQVLTILPLVAPPFVGAFAVGRLLHNNGMITNLVQIFIPQLSNLLGEPGSPVMIWGIIFLQSIHLWPLIFFNTAASYSKIDPAQEEQARNLGSWSINLYRQIILPLITPGFVAGAVLVFIWSISDLGTPIVLNFFDYAPFLAFSEIRDERATEETLANAYALVIILLIVSLLALLFASKVVGMRDYAPEKVSGMEQTRLMQKASRPKTLLIVSILLILLITSLLPHIGIIFVAFVERIKFGEILPSLWTLDGVVTTLGKADISAMIVNSLIYSAFAMLITIIIGIIVGYLLVRKKNLKGISIIMTIIGVYVGLLLGAQLAANFSGAVEKNLLMFGMMIIVASIFFVIGKTLNLRCLEIFSTMPFAVPGVVLAVGYLTFFSSTTSLWGILPSEIDYIPVLGFFTAAIRKSILSIPDNPLELRFTSFWFILVVSYAMRRMPYAVQSSTAVLRQIHESLEEVAHNLGATATNTLRRITIPLMASGVIAGGILSFITSFTEVSTSIMITPTNRPFMPLFPFSPLSDPLTKGIYDEIKRGGDVAPPGVMGLVQLLVAAIGMAITQKLLGEKTGTAFGG
ncbi:MAG: ABC transporter permease [Candidatus Hodarchaeales archaeon]|jgi:iron(III) transport system permease protein